MVKSQVSEMEANDSAIYRVSGLLLLYPPLNARLVIKRAPINSHVGFLLECVHSSVFACSRSSKKLVVMIILDEIGLSHTTMRTEGWISM